MASKKWAELKAKTFTPAQLAKIDERVAYEALEMDLRALREASGKTQAELAALTEMTQSELSRVERRADHKLSTIKRFVEGLGGQVEIAAIVDGKRVTLHI